jgi:hypothetical protein
LAECDPPVIFLSTGVVPDLAIGLVAKHLAEFFDSASFAEEVELLLTTDDAEMETLLVQIFQVPIVAVPTDSSKKSSVLETVPSEPGNDLRDFADATEEIFEDAREEISDSEVDVFGVAIKEPSPLEEIESFKDATEEILREESLRPHRRHSNDSEIPTVQIAAELYEDYANAISTINCNFEVELGKTRYKDLSPLSNTGFAGEFWVLSS